MFLDYYFVRDLKKQGNIKMSGRNVTLDGFWVWKETSNEEWLLKSSHAFIFQIFFLIKNHGLQSYNEIVKNEKSQNLRWLTVQ